MKTTLHITLLTLSLLAVSFSAKAENSEPLRIGFIIPLTGPLADFGAAIRNGVRLAEEDNPKVRKVFTPVYEDSQYQSKTAVTNFRKLRSVDGVQAVYVFGGPMSDTLAPLAEQTFTPMFSTEYDVRYTKERKYVIRFANNAESYAESLLQELRSRNLHRFGIIKVDNQYHNTLSDALINSLNAEEEATLIANVPPGENDFRAVIAKLRREKFDALGVYLTPGMQHSFFTQLKSSGLRFPLFGTDSFESREENRGVEEVVEGAIFANSSVSDSFVKRYRTRFNSTSQVVHAALAYEFALLVADLFSKESAPNDVENFVKRFALSNSRASVCGEYFYRMTPETGQYFSFPIAVRQVRNGENSVISIRKAP